MSLTEYRNAAFEALFLSKTCVTVQSIGYDERGARLFGLKFELDGVGKWYERNDEILVWESRKDAFQDLHDTILPTLGMNLEKYETSSFEAERSGSDCL